MGPKNEKNPMDRLPDWRVTMPMAHASPRCGAKTKRANSCRAPAMPNGRCHLHGGKSTGSRTIEGLERIRAARTIHGGYGAEMTEFRECVRAIKARGRKLVEAV